MESYDILMLVVLVAATLFGAYKGLAWQIASLASIFVSYFVAIRFRGPVAKLIGIEHSEWNTFLAMLILYIGTSVFIWLGFRLVSKSINELKLKSLDRQIGALFGAAKGVILCVVITLFAVALLREGQRQSIIQSRSGFYIARLLDRAEAFIPVEIHRKIEPYIHSLDGSSQPAYGDARTETMTADDSRNQSPETARPSDRWPYR